MNVLEILAVVAIVIYVIVRQALGEPIRAKRLITLPGILTLIGVVDLSKHTIHTSSSDIVLIALGAAIAAGIGLTQGHLIHLEKRDRSLWGQLPRPGVWLWVALYASRGVLIGVAHAAGAHVAGGVQAELLILGVNRLSQAAVVAWRAQTAGIPFAPEKARRRSPLLASGGRANPSPFEARPTDSRHASIHHEGLERQSSAQRLGGLALHILEAASTIADSRTQQRHSRQTDRRHRRRRGR